jgi:hypothetical protein
MTPDELRWRLNTTIDQLTNGWGLPSITAKTLVLNAFGTLVGQGAQIAWHDSHMGFEITLVVSPGVVDENHGYADFLAQPMQREIERLQGMAGDEASLLTKKKAMESGLLTMDKQDPAYDKTYADYLEFLEVMNPRFMLRVLPDRSHPLPLSSALVIDDAGEVLRQAFASESGEALAILGKGYTPEDGRLKSYGAVLEPPPELFGKVLTSIYSEHWRPVILPSASSFVPTHRHGPERIVVAQMWAETVAYALKKRRSRHRLFKVGINGIEAVNRVIEVAKSKTSAARHRGKFRWVAKVAVKLAGIFHLIQGGIEDEISPTAWREAEAHMKALIDAHGEAAAITAPRLKKQKAFFGRPGDLRTISNYMLDNPQAKLSDVTKALSKRQPGYWKALFTELTRR